MQLNLLEEWITDGNEIPPRSRLYSRLPHGHGTAMQESQISYLVNMAKAHTLTPRILIEREIIPCGHIEYDSRSSSGFYGYYTRTINFLSKYAEEISNALNQLTGQSCLAQNTFLPWKDVLDPRGGGLLHRHPRWCPDCLKERREADLEPYFPLLWYVMLVEHCPEHGCAFESKCPHCDHEQPFVPRHYHIDHCSYCGSWLGPSTKKQTFRPVTPDAFELYAVQAISEMIRENARAAGYANCQRFRDRIVDYKSLVSDGSSGGLGKKVGLQGTVINQWLLKGRRPQIKNMLQLTYYLGTTPVQLLRDDLPTNLHEPPDQEIQFKRRTQRNLSPEVKKSFETKLQAYLDRDELPPTLHEIATEFGQTISFLKYRFPKFCRAIADKRRAMYVAKEIGLSYEIEERSYEITIALLKSSRRASRRMIDNALRPHKISMLHPAARAGVKRAKEEFFSTTKGQQTG